MLRTILCALFVSPSVFAAPFDDIKGSWSGAVQLNASHQPTAHVVGRLSLHVGADGALDAVHQSGCKISGIVQRSTAQVYTVDVRFTSCPFAEYNRRWSGTLARYPKEGTVVISIRSSEILIGKASKMFDAKGTLQR